MTKGGDRPTDKSLFWQIVEDRDVRLDHVQRAVLRYLADVGGAATDFELRMRVNHPPSRIRQALEGLVLENLLELSSSEGYEVASLTRVGQRVA
ncbi:hypothetical protein [Enhygromyxa salina]|uniref:hypothetical protein n=1 Tax=Enhygromyxa salina TaxID=215803 RepID=UPI000D04303F|nr:hypothetical protein [Enhygromyxa salina]